MSLLRRALRLPFADQRLLAEAVAGLVVAGALLRIWPFRRLAARMGTHMAESPGALDPATADEAARIRWAVEACARHLPWHPVCLPQAIAAQWMLRRRGIASTLYLGVRPGAQYDAHAWVRAGSLIVTGGPTHVGFAVVASFAHAPAR